MTGLPSTAEDSDNLRAHWSVTVRLYCFMFIYVHNIYIYIYMIYYILYIIFLYSSLRGCLKRQSTSQHIRFGRFIARQKQFLVDACRVFLVCVLLEHMVSASNLRTPSDG